MRNLYCTSVGPIQKNAFKRKDLKANAALIHWCQQCRTFNLEKQKLKLCQWV